MLTPPATWRVLAVFPLSTGGEASVPWSFVKDAGQQPDYPEYVCPASIVHGVNDEVVPVTVTRSLVEGRWVGDRTMKERGAL